MIVWYHKFIKYRLEIACLYRQRWWIESGLIVANWVNSSTLHATTFLIKDSFLHIITPFLFASTSTVTITQPSLQASAKMRCKKLRSYHENVIYLSAFYRLLLSNVSEWRKSALIVLLIILWIISRTGMLGDGKVKKNLRDIFSRHLSTFNYS